MFTVEKLLETFTKKPKTPPKRRLQRSPKIIGYERECSDEMPSELKEPLLSYEHNIDYYDDQRKVMKEVVYNKSSNNNNNNVRVKVTLTKEEAEKLLGKCKEEGTLEFKDVVMQLGKLPPQRINVVGVTSLTTDLDLATIIEEDEDDDDDDDHE